MENIEKLLSERQFEKVEKLLKRNLENCEDIDTLMKMALIRLQFPFADEDSAIDYLNKIIERDNYNFSAIVIKLYLQNFYRGNMDNDLIKMAECNWNTDCESAISYYVISWKYHDIYSHANALVEKDYLLKSISQYPYLVNPYLKLAQLYALEGDTIQEKKCYRYALENVKNTEYVPNDVINPKAFIEEYIMGVSMSEINYKYLIKKCHND